jgi:hypothetical protein
MADAEEIRMPDDPARLIQHGPVDVLITVVTGQGEQRPVLGGRCTTSHLRPNGAIVVVKPQLPAHQMPPVKRSDAVHVRYRRSQSEALDADGTVSWVRQRAFLPSGLAVSFIGITFGWDADERALEVAAFLARQSLPPPA